MGGALRCSKEDAGLLLCVIIKQGAAAALLVVAVDRALEAEKHPGRGCPRSLPLSGASEDVARRLESTRVHRAARGLWRIPLATPIFEGPPCTAVGLRVRVVCSAACQWADSWARPPWHSAQ